MFKFFIEAGKMYIFVLMFQETSSQSTPMWITTYR